MLLFLFSWLVRSNSLQPHGLQHARLPCPSLSPRVCSKSCPLSRWRHPTISSCHPLFLLPSTFPSISVFPISWLFASCGQSIEASASASGLPINIQDWFPLGLTGLISCCPGDSQKSSPGPQFKNISSLAVSLLYGATLISICDDWIGIFKMDTVSPRKQAFLELYGNIALGLAFSQWEIKLMPLADWVRAIKRGGSTWVLPSLSWTQREKWVRKPSFIHRFIGNIQAKLYSKTVKMQILFHCVNSMQHAYKERIVILHSQARHVAMHYSECFIGTSLVVQWFRTLCFHFWGYGFSPWLRN